MSAHKRLLRAIVHPVALLVLTPASAAQADIGTIDLKPSARVAPGDPTLLRDVATLGGAPAISLGGVVVRQPGAGAMSFEITAADVRAALSARSVNWGRLALRGSICQVRVGERSRPHTADEPRKDAQPATVELVGPPNVRKRLAEVVGRMFGVDNADLRLRFDERDAPLLNRTLDATTRVEIQPASTASSSRMAFVIWMYEGETLEPTSSTVRVEVLVRREIITATRQIRRGEAVTERDIASDTQWLAPDGSAPVAAMKNAVGMRARRTIDAGAILRAEALEPPLACQRGDLVKVHCVSGGVVVKAWARAMDKAHEGEFVELRLADGEKTFRARMTERGVAVMGAPN